MYTAVEGTSLSTLENVKMIKGDIEEGEVLYPGLGYGENQLRWGFIRKVYGILSAQLVLTTIVSSATVLYTPINDTLRDNSGLLLFFAFLPFFCMSHSVFDLTLFVIIFSLLRFVCCGD